MADRSPDRHEVALPYGIRFPPSLRREYRVLRHTAHLDPAHVGDLPVHRPATILIHLATRPTDVRSWSGVLDCLSALIQLSSYDEIATELRGRPKSVHVRDQKAGAGGRSASGTTLDDLAQRLAGAA